MALNDRELLAKTLQAEAGNQGIGGMLAVGSVIRNRMAQGGSLSDVILAPAQFSAWNKVTGAVGGEQGQDMAALKPSEDAYAAADAILSGNAPDVTGGATHYYNPSISNPAWGKEKAGGDWTKIGAHIFGKAGDFRTGAAKMNGEQTQKPQGLLGGLLGGQGIGGALGMSDDFRDKLKMAILAGTGDARMDPLIEATQARMQERRDEAKEQRQRNKSLEYLKQLADAGDAMAGQIYGAVSTGVLPVGAGLSTYLTQSLKGQTVTDTADYKNYLEFKKTNPDITFEEFYTNFKNKPDIQNKGVYRDKSGNIIGEVNFDKSTGQFFQYDPNGQRQILDMKELTPVTDATFANTIPKYNDFVKLSEGLQDDIGSLRQLEKYMTEINNTNEGFARLADDLSASAKTLLSSYFGPEYTNLSKEELALRVGRGLQQGLIGRFRIETVGGGVMTEQDALRIIQNLGGDVSLLQNKEVVSKQIQNLFEAKKSSFDRRKKRHDIALNQIYKDQGFEEIQPYEFDESVFNLKGSVSDTKTTMTDDQLLSGAQGKTGAALSQYLQSLSEADFNRLMQLQQ
jgi:hypothetical protein